MDIQQNIFPSTNIIIQEQPSEPLMNADVQQHSTNYMPMALWSIYWLITLILFIRFILNINKIRKSIHDNFVQSFGNYKLVFVPENDVTFSFFKYIFPAESDMENKELNPEIFQHEMVHIKEKHSLDILFIEMIKTFLWFNPFVFLYKKAIQINHEFIADDIVVQNNDVSNYQHLLLTKITQTPISQLVSSSNYSITKKRFIMMTKKTKHIKAAFLKLSVLPIIGIMIFGFSKRVIANPNYDSNAEITESIIESNLQDDDSDIVSTYKNLFNSVIQYGTDKNGNKTCHYNASRDKFLKLEKMYKSMNNSQKTQVDSLPLFVRIALDNPNPYPKQQKPTDAQIKKWSEHPELWAIWYNEKRIKNADLKNYNMHDFAHYHAYALEHENSLRQGFNVEIQIEDQDSFDNEVKNYKKWNDPIEGGWQR